MFKLLKDRCGQVVFAEYILTFFLVVGVIMAMGVYVRRAVQGRMLAAHSYVFKDVNAVFADPAMNFQGNFWAQYEPYYTNSQAMRAYSQGQTTRNLPGGRWGLVEYVPQERITTQSRRDQASPEFAN